MEVLQPRSCNQHSEDHSTRCHGSEALFLMDCRYSHHEKKISLLESIKSCGERKDLGNGIQIHADILRCEGSNLFKKDICIHNALISMYTKCGHLVKAQEVFDQIPTPSLVSWNALISGYTQNGLNDLALNCFRLMQEKGISPNSVTFTCILKACGSLRLAKEGETIHAEIKKRGLLLLERNVVLGTALVDMYSKCGLHVKAREMLDELPIRNIVSWNALLVGYIRDGLVYEAIKCFEKIREEGLSPDGVTFVCMLKACGISKSIEVGEEIYGEVRRRQGLLEKDVVLGNALVDMYVKCGDLSKAQGVFNELPRKNVVTWTSLIDGYAQNGLCMEALSCYRQMCQRGMSPDSVTISCILKACGKLKSIETGKEIHAELSKQGLLEKNVVLCTALVDMYIGCDALTKAQEAFDQIREPDAVLWTLLISGYADSGLGDKALKLFQQMHEQGLAPDACTFACTLKASSSMGMIWKGGTIHVQCRNQGLLEKHIMLGNALVDMYAKCGALSKAKEVFDELLVPDIVSWNALLTGYSQHGQSNEVFALFNQLIAQGILPNGVTFLVLLSACSHGGLVEEGDLCFHWMDTLCGVKPTPGHYTCLVDLFGRAGQFHKAVIVVENVSPFDRFSSWLSLLGSCQKWDKMELGRWAFEHLVHLNAKYAGSYVCINNIYATSNVDVASGGLVEVEMDNFI